MLLQSHPASGSDYPAAAGPVDQSLTHLEHPTDWGGAGGFGGCAVETNTESRGDEGLGACQRQRTLTLKRTCEEVDRKQIPAQSLCRDVVDVEQRCVTSTLCLPGLSLLHMYFCKKKKTPIHAIILMNPELFHSVLCFTGVAHSSLIWSLYVWQFFQRVFSPPRMSSPFFSAVSFVYIDHVHRNEKQNSDV